MSSEMINYVIGKIKGFVKDKGKEEE